MNTSRNPDEILTTNPGSPSRSDRLIRSIQPTINHDIPNLLVVMQGFMQILDEEEKERLSTEGRNYINRLLHVLGRLQNISIALKGILKAETNLAHPEEISLPEFIREAKAAIKQKFPHLGISLHSAFKVQKVVGQRLLLNRCFVELIRLMAENTGADEFHCYIASLPVSEGVELLVGESGEALEHVTKFRSGPEINLDGDFDLLGPDSRIHIILVREMVDLWGGAFSVKKVLPQGDVVFQISIPANSS